MHLRRLMELPKNLSHTAWNHSNITPFSQTPDQLAARLEMWNCIKCLSWSSLTVSTKRWSRWWLSHPPLLCCTDLPPVLHLLWEPSVSWLSSLSLETPCMQKDSFYLRIHVSPLAPSRFNMLSWCLPWERSHLGHWLAISQPAAQEPRNVETGPTDRRWPHFFFFSFMWVQHRLRNSSVVLNGFQSSLKLYCGLLGTVLVSLLVLWKKNGQEIEFLFHTICETFLTWAKHQLSRWGVKFQRSVKNPYSN